MRKENLFLIYLGRSGAGPKITLDLTTEIIINRDIIEFGLVISDKNLLKKEILEEKKDTKIINTPISNFETVFNLPKFIFQFIKILKEAKKNNFNTFLFPMTHIWNPICMLLINIYIKKPNILYICHAFSFPTRSLRDFFEKIILKIEILLSDKIITLTSQVEKDIYKYKKNKSITTLFHPLFKTKNINTVRELPEIPSFLLFGRILKYKGISLMLKSIQKIENKKIKVIIAGSGEIEPEDKIEIEKINTYSRIVEVKNYYLSEEEVEEIWDKTDVCMIPYLNSLQSGVIPIAINKAIPTLITPHNSLIEQCFIDTDTPVALMSKEISSDSFAKTIEDILNKNIYKKISENCIKVQDDLSWKTFLNKILNIK